MYINPIFLFILLYRSSVSILFISSGIICNVQKENEGGLITVLIPIMINIIASVKGVTAELMMIPLVIGDNFEDREGT